LVSAIRAYLQEHNSKPKPFLWTASADRILEKTAKLCKSLG
ncbi:MAG TPA: IS630 family transposase, partial [Chthoniobacter sp.]|nr:IS630 family transposase [Chthoniobacter sp.]